MKLPALIRVLLLHALLFCAVPVLAQGSPALGDASPGGSAFDYDRALAISQAAIGRSVADVRFLRADGHSLSFSEFRGKPLVLSMVYTSCYQICPMTTRFLSEVVDKARTALGDDSFAVAVVGFDVHVDTPAAMRYFASKQGIDDKDWQLLSGNSSAVEQLASDIGFQYLPTSNGFDHLIQATVIDAEGRVYRQVYGQVFETPLLVDPLIELVLGSSPSEQPLLANLVDRIKLFCTTYDPARDGYYFDYSLFIGMLIGGSIIVFTAVIVVRGLHNGQV
ncbi:MAG: SCO family protein [Gammaproteobacteria bacterium]|jgi:protein SCO1/2|nr:SCO family protein [Gammaproteobacteria bacterium]